jgi:DNA polymerase III delta prime subunit
LTVAELEKIERRIAGRVLGKGGWGVMVNEAHALTTAVIRRLLVMLERIPAHVVWIFTTTVDGQAELFDKQDDSAPLLSRCNVIPLAQRGLCEAIAQRTMEIARAEGLDGKPLSAYVRLTKDNRNNMRANLSQVEAGCMMAD